MSSDVYESFINTIRAEAWDEGQRQGYDDAYEFTATPNPYRNPYQKEQTDEH